MNSILSLNKKTLFITSFFLLAITFSSSCLAQTYKIACLKDYHPYTSVNENNELTGILIDWWELWAKENDVDILFVPTDIQGCLDKTLSGETDIIAGLFFDEKRANEFDYADNILKMKSVLFIDETIKVDSIEQLTNPIGVVENDLAKKYLQENYPNSKLSIFDSYTALRYAAQNHELSAFVYDVPDVIGNYKINPEPEGYIALKTLFLNSLKPMVKKGNQQLLNLIITGTNDISNDELVKIAPEWEIYNSSKKYFYLIFGFLIILLIGGLIYFIIKRKFENKPLQNLLEETDWLEVINKGENDAVEFKSSLRWDYNQEKTNKVLEGVIIKTISAFLNSNGGTLLIGVNDEGKILGLNEDYNSLSKKNRDGFLLALTNLINRDLGKKLHKYISINIISINESDICIVSSLQSEKPVFIKKNDKEEFYIRTSASVQPLNVKEAYDYINLHWK